MSEGQSVADVSEQRAEEVFKTSVFGLLDLFTPDQRPVVAARVFAQIIERLSKRDTQRVRMPPLPREEP